jgi:CPA1 family monovalent cation:H+ antiporter
VGETPFLVALLIAVAVVASSALARTFTVPGPVLLALTGIGISFIPSFSHITISPDLVLVVFLPALIYHTAFYITPRELRWHWIPITVLGVGLVVATLLAVAVTGYALIAGLPLASAFVLGAVLSPTDTVAPAAVISRLGLPRAIRVLVEGESLVNDAIALVAYSLAVGAATSGTYSIPHSLLRFVEVAAGGIAIGVAVGWLVGLIRPHVSDAGTALTISLMTPYVAFIPANEAHLSGVLATASAGVYLGAQGQGLFPPGVRLRARSFWEMLVFLLNAALFVLLGLQFRPVIDGLGHYSLLQLIADGALASGIVVTLRLLWVLAMPNNALRLPPLVPSDGDRRSRSRLVLGWSGVRGAVSLAAALAIPLTIQGGAPFPGRDLLLFIVFCVILTTLVVQGGSLPWLLRLLGFREEAGFSERSVQARIRLTEAALGRLEELARSGGGGVAELGALRELYEARLSRLEAFSESEDVEEAVADVDAYRSFRQEINDAERDTLHGVFAQGELTLDEMHRLEQELDFELLRHVEG